MTNRTHVGVLCFLLAAGQVGCDGGPASPTAPSSQTPQAAPKPEPLVANHILKPVALFGVITETTPTGDAPIAGVTVYCDLCGEKGHTWTETGADGSYRFSGDLGAGGGIWLYSNQTTIWVGKDGYQDPPGTSWGTGTGWKQVQIDGDTRFDMRLVRQ